MFEDNQLTNLGAAILCIGGVLIPIGTIWLLVKYGPNSRGGGGSSGSGGCGSSCGGGGGCGGGCGG